MCSIAIVVLTALACGSQGIEERLNSQEANCTASLGKELSGSERVMMQRTRNHAKRTVMVDDDISKVISSEFLSIGKGQCTDEDGAFSSLGWAECVCGKPVGSQCAVGSCPSQEKCSAECDALQNCAAFGWYPGHCWLYAQLAKEYTKTSALFPHYECYIKPTQTTTTTTTTTMYRSYTKLTGICSTSGDPGYALSPTASWNLCGISCDNDPSCKGFVFFGPSYCQMFTQCTETTSLPYLPYGGTVFQGTTGLYPSEAAASRETCAAACDADANCQGFTGVWGSWCQYFTSTLTVDPSTTKFTSYVKAPPSDVWPSTSYAKILRETQWVTRENTVFQGTTGLYPSEAAASWETCAAACDADANCQGFVGVWGSWCQYFTSTQKVDTSTTKFTSYVKRTQWVTRENTVFQGTTGLYPSEAATSWETCAGACREDVKCRGFVGVWGSWCQYFTETEKVDTSTTTFTSYIKPRPCCEA